MDVWITIWTAKCVIRVVKKFIRYKQLFFKATLILPPFVIAPRPRDRPFSPRRPFYSLHRRNIWFIILFGFKYEQYLSNTKVNQGSAYYIFLNIRKVHMNSNKFFVVSGLSVLRRELHSFINLLFFHR